MAGAVVLMLGGDRKTLSPEALAALGGSLSGELALPDTAGWQEARTVWNAMIDRRPGLVVRCHSADDVVHAVRFAVEHDLLVAVKGGGHNIAGNGVCEGGLLIDLSPMKAVSVDARGRRVRVQPGATLADLDRATQKHGLATPVGINSTTGVAGLTLGGGFGWLSRKHGLTVDNLLRLEMVTADSVLIGVSPKEHENLFWAVRGGGGNFGVVTSFEYALHSVGPEITAGLIVHPFADARNVLRAYREVVGHAADELAAWCVLRQAPPLPFLPPEVHGTKVVIMPVFWCGDAAGADAAMEPLRAIGEPLATAIGRQPYAEWQQAFDPLLTPGARNYWKSHDFTELSDATIDVLLDSIERLPGPQCEIFVGHLGGAVNRHAPTATAYPHRDAEFVLNVHARWETQAEDAACTAWARDFHAAAAPHATGGVYVNFQPEDELGSTRAAYGVNRERLLEIKQRWDPDNRFRVNQNLRPGVAAPA